MSKQRLNCAHCERAFRAKRITARFCSDACRKAQNRADNTSIISVTKHATLSLPILSVTPAPAASVGASSGIPDGIAPLRWRAPLGDKDIRDICGPSPGTEIDMPDLSAFLERRNVGPVTLKAAA
jgi:hypothetical protein